MRVSTVHSGYEVGSGKRGSVLIYSVGDIVGKLLDLVMDILEKGVVGPPSY